MIDPLTKNEIEKMFTDINLKMLSAGRRPRCNPVIYGADDNHILIYNNDPRVLIHFDHSKKSFKQLKRILEWRFCVLPDDLPK